MGISNEYEAIITNEVDQTFDDFNPILKSNKKNLGTFYNNIINIYNLNPPNFNLIIENSISCKEKINYIDFNPEYPQIIMSALNNGDVKLWNISNKINNDKEICIFKGHSSYVNFALFNPEKSTMVLSSDNKNIKLWDINNYLIDYIAFHEDYIDKIKWNFSGDKYGYISDRSKLVINETNENKSLLIIKEEREKDIYDFIFKDYNKIITFHKNRIKSWDIRYFNAPLKTYQNINFSSYLYDNNLEYLYSIQKNRIEIYKADDFDKKEQELKISNLINPKNIILLDAGFLEDNEIANFLELNQFGSRIIKIKKENFSNKKEVMNQAIINQNQPKKSLKEYLDSIVYKISDYSELLKFNKKIKSNDTKIKPKYLEISELSNEFKSIEAQSFFQRKQYVQDNIDQIDYINNPTDKCLFYLKLLIRDNTNTRLIKEYLSFLKRNPQLEALNLDYKKELEYYMVCLTKSELNKLKEEKANDEKDNLIRFLSKLYEAEEKNYAKFSEEIKTKEIKNILFLISQ